MEIYGVIYCITCLLNGMKYVGQTTQPLGRRIGQHKRGDQYIDHAIQKYGWENFTVEVLEECTSREQLNEREIFWIAELKCMSPNGYNFTGGGEGIAGLNFTPEHCFKLSSKRRDESPFKNLLKELINRQLIYTALEKLLGLVNVSKKMLGKENFTAEQVDKLVEFFGLSAEYLLKRDDGKIFVSKKYETPYKNLLSEMKKRQLTYTALAKLLDLSRTTFSGKMHGECYFTTKDIAKLVEIFGLPAEYLVARDDGLSATTSKAEKCARLSATIRHSSYKNLLCEMDRRKITYRELAELLSLNRKTVSEKMRGEYKFTSAQVAKLVEIFGLSADYLMKRDE